MHITRLSQTLFFMGLLLAVAPVCAMNVQKNYAFALKDFGAGCCIPQEDYDHELPYLLPDKKHTTFLTQTLYDGFMNERLFITAMAKANQLPAEIISLIAAKSRIIASQGRDMSAEEVLQERHGITYTDICYLTKAHKQLLLYCVTDAPHNNGILTIEGDDEEFSHEMFHRFCSLPLVIQAKLAQHANGNSIYVKTDYATEPSLFNKLLGEDFAARDRNIKRLASIAGIAIPVALAIMVTTLAMQHKIPHNTMSLYEKAIVAVVKGADARLKEGMALGIPIAVIALVIGIIGSPITLLLMALPLVSIIITLFICGALGVNVHDQVVQVLGQTLPESMQNRGFEEIFVG